MLLQLRAGKRSTAALRAGFYVSLNSSLRFSCVFGEMFYLAVKR